MPYAVSKTLENKTRGKMRNAKPRRGRPSRAQASREALAGVDVSKLDPLDVLRAIAADSSAPASARVARGCKSLSTNWPQAREKAGWHNHQNLLVEAGD
jgi:hypothetical protein